MSAPPIITPDVLEQVGQALYGEQWRGPLARDLLMSERSIRYLASGDRPISAGVARDLAAIVDARLVTLGELGELLWKAGGE